MKPMKIAYLSAALSISMSLFCSACTQENEIIPSIEAESTADTTNVENVIFWNDWHRTEFEDVVLTQSVVFAFYEKTDDPEQLYAFSASHLYWIEQPEFSDKEDTAMRSDCTVDMAWELVMQDLGLISYEDYPLDVYTGRNFFATLDQINAIEETARYRGCVVRIMPLLSPELIEDARKELIEMGYEHSVNDSYTVTMRAFEIRKGPKQVAVEIELDNPE